MFDSFIYFGLNPKSYTNLKKISDLQMKAGYENPHGNVMYLLLLKTKHITPLAKIIKKSPLNSNKKRGQIPFCFFGTA